MYANTQSVTKWMVTCVLVAGTVGCGMSNHEKHMNAANNRWRAMRSTLILQMAQQQFEAGDLEQAEKSLAEAIKVDAANAQLYTLAGRVAVERGQLERGYHRFKMAIELDEQHAQAHYFQGIVMQRWAQHDAALIFYRRAYEIEPDNAGYLLAMSEMLVVLDRVDEAMSLLTEKMAYFDMNAGVRVAIGELYLMRKQYGRAVKYFQQAVLIRPDDRQIQEQLALTLLKAGKVRQAVRRLEQLSQDSGVVDRKSLSRALAEAYVEAGRPDDGKAIYIKLTRANPMDAEAWLKLGELALSEHDTAGAMLAANRVKKLAPERHDAYVLAALVFSKQGQIEHALENLDHAAELASDDPVPVLLRGIALEHDGRLADAAEAYSEALRRQPDDERAQQLLIRVSAAVEQKMLTSD